MSFASTEFKSSDRLNLFSSLTFNKVVSADSDFFNKDSVVVCNNHFIYLSLLKFYTIIIIHIVTNSKRNKKIYIFNIIRKKIAA